MNPFGTLDRYVARRFLGIYGICLLGFVLLAFAGAALALAGCDWIWKKRSLSVRAPLVERRSGLR